MLWVFIFWIELTKQGNIIAVAVLGLVADKFGWRIVFVTLAIISGLPLLSLFFLTSVEESAKVSAFRVSLVLFWCDLGVEIVQSVSVEARNLYGSLFCAIRNDSLRIWRYYFSRHRSEIQNGRVQGRLYVHNTWYWTG